MEIKKILVFIFCCKILILPKYSKGELCFFVNIYYLLIQTGTEYTIVGRRRYKMKSSYSEICSQNPTKYLSRSSVLVTLQAKC